MQEAYTAYQQHFKESPASFLRDCLELTPSGKAIALEDVESAELIMERFCTGGMSLGAISRETHETIAIAMNRIGGALRDLLEVQTWAALMRVKYICITSFAQH